MKNLLTEQNIASSPIEEGDAGIIIKPNGEFKLFTTGVIDGDNLSPQQLHQGRTLKALALALAVPDIMGVLLRMSEDPMVVGDAGIAISLPH